MKHGSNLFWQTGLVLLAVLRATRGATERATRLLGWFPRLGEPLFVILHMPVYHTQAFFGAWSSFNAYALNVFNRGELIAVSGGVAASVIALTESILRVRRTKGKGICNFGPLNPRGTVHDLMQSLHAVAAPRSPQITDVLLRHFRQKARYAC